MNREINANQAKLPVYARIGGAGTLPIKARIKRVQGKSQIQKKPVVKITRTIESGIGRVNLKKRTLIARGGTILRINRNVPLNTGKKFVKAGGRKTLQTKNIRNIKLNKPVNNLNSSTRKVEFDDQGGLAVQQNVQDNFMGNVNYVQNDLRENVNYGFEDMPTFSNSVLLPTPSLLQTPPVQQRIFPPVHEGPFHNNQQDLMDESINHLRELERQKAQEDLNNIRELERREKERKKAQEELRALERKRMEQKMIEEEQRRFEEEQKHFQEEQRQYEEEQRRIEDEKIYIERLRKSLEYEKRDLEILKKTVEEEEIERRRSISKGREMANDSFRMPAVGLFDYAAKKNKNENREIFDSRVNNDHNRYGKEDFNPKSQKMSSVGLLDYMLDKPIGARGSEREELGRDFRGRGGERGRNFGSRGGKRGGGGGGGGVNKNTNFNSSGGGRGISTNTRGRGGGWGGKNNKKSYDQNSKFNDSERGFNTRDTSQQSQRTPSAAGLMDYMLDKQSRGAPSSSQGGNFGQSNDYYPNDFNNASRGREYDDASRRREYDDASRGREYDYASRGREYNDSSRGKEYDTSRGREYDDTSRGREYNFSGGNNNAANSFQREYEMTSNQNQNYGNQTESGYQILSRGFKPPLKIDEQKPEYQNTNNNFGSYQESFGGHPYYDNFYDQGRINRNYPENSGRLGSFGNQGTFTGTPFSSNSGENKFGFVGYPFKNKTPIYEVGKNKTPIYEVGKNKKPKYEAPRKSEKNYSSSNQGVAAGYTSNNKNRQEKPTDSFYSYRPNDKKNDDLSKSGRSGTDGINIFGVGASLTEDYSGNSSANLGQNSSRSHGGSDFFGKVVQNDNMGSRSYSKFGSANDAGNKDVGDDPQEYIKKLKKKRRNFQHNLKTLPPSRFQKKQTVQKNLQLVNDEISRLENQYGQTDD